MNSGKCWQILTNYDEKFVLPVVDYRFPRTVLCRAPLVSYRPTTPLKLKISFDPTSIWGRRGGSPHCRRVPTRGSAPHTVYEKEKREKLQKMRRLAAFIRLPLSSMQTQRLRSNGTEKCEKTSHLTLSHLPKDWQAKKASALTEKVMTWERKRAQGDPIKTALDQSPLTYRRRKVTTGI